MNGIKSHVLVVEDESKWQNLIMRCDFLRQLKQQSLDSVIIVSDYEAAVKEVREHHFDVVITDFFLGDQGDQFPWRSLARLLQQKKIPIVVISGYLTDADLMSELVNDFNIVGLFHKAKLDPKILSERLKEILVTSEGVKSKDLNKEMVRSSVTIVHLSDLHFGPKHRLAERYSDDLPHNDIPDLAAAIVSDVKQKGFTIDALVISGDLSHSATMPQFNWARTFIESLTQGFALSLDQVIVVPGNHDINWQEEPLPNHEGSSNYQTFHELLYKDKVKDRSRLFRTTFIQGRNLFIAGLDSCVIEGENTAGIGYVGLNQLNVVLDEVQNISKNHPDCIKIAVLHHHLLPVGAITGFPTQGKNFSLVMDASSVLRKLYQENFIAVLHGHQHQPYCADMRLYGEDIDRTMPIAIIGSGSIGAKRESLGSISRNHYSVIEIQTYDQHIEVHVTGRISSDQQEAEFKMYEDEKVLVLA